MGNKTNIGWCDMTFNPWIGCAKVSPGCDNCYAEALNKRFGFVRTGAANAPGLSALNPRFILMSAGYRVVPANGARPAGSTADNRQTPASRFRGFSPLTARGCQFDHFADVGKMKTSANQTILLTSAKRSPRQGKKQGGFLDVFVISYLACAGS